MELGHLNEKANQSLVFFVFGCIIVIIGFLQLMQQAQELEYNAILNSEIAKYLD